MHQIRLAYDRWLPQVLATGEDFPWRSRPAYASWLAQTYHYIVHTSRIIALAASRCDRRHDELHRRLVHYLNEESDHDLLALDDLRALGHSIEEFPEHPLTAAFYQVDYYRIEHETPLALFGRSLLLEGAAAAGADRLADQVAEAFGEKTATFLRLHGREDPSHVDNAFRALEGVGQEEEAVIAAALTQSGVIYLAMMDAIRRECGG
jgi:pyrroloquinoline quinone (PQQ) biosynthesis protein C